MDNIAQRGELYDSDFHKNKVSNFADKWAYGINRGLNRPWESKNFTSVKPNPAGYYLLAHHRKGSSLRVFGMIKR
jgi:hypothetical protein